MINKDRKERCRKREKNYRKMTIKIKKARTRANNAKKRKQKHKGYRMVLSSICEHVSSAFVFASASSEQFSHASSEHTHFVNLPPSGISLS